MKTSHAFLKIVIAASALALVHACIGVGPPVEAPLVEADHPSAGTASPAPPGNLSPDQVPLFVQFGFDDNSISGREGSGTTGGVHFVRELFADRTNPAGEGNPKTFDGSPARFSLYVITRHLAAAGVDSPEYVRPEWRAVADDGHEIGLHTHTHPHGRELDSAAWLEEIGTCREWLTSSNGLGLSSEVIVGFRTPYLEHGPPLFPALRQAGVQYDCSIEEGFEDGFHAGNFYWPYRIGPAYGGTEGGDVELWEIPVYALIVPPDEFCPTYGVPPGLRDRLHAVKAYFDPADGKITGFDWNLWDEFGMSREEVVATFKYTLDQRLAGNRAPLTFGAHSDMYSDQYPGGDLPATAEERRQALREIVDHALSRPEVRLVSASQILDWLRAPSPLVARR